MARFNVARNITFSVSNPGVHTVGGAHVAVAIVKLTLFCVTWSIAFSITDPFGKALSSTEIFPRAITIVLVAFVSEALVVALTIT